MCLLISGIATAIPSTPSVCPMTPTGSWWRTPLSSSWIPPKVPGMVQKGSSTKRSRGSQLFSLCQEFGLGTPRKGGVLEVGLTAASQKRMTQSRHSASGKHYCCNRPLNVQGWVAQWPPRMRRQTQGYRHSSLGWQSRKDTFIKEFFCARCQVPGTVLPASQVLSLSVLPTFYPNSTKPPPCPHLPSAPNPLLRFS